MRILMVGDIVGAPGRRAAMRWVPELRKAMSVDLVVANAENAAGGRGLTQPLAEELLAAGIDVLTLGDHAWDQRDMVDYIERNPRILRPHNLPPGCPGRGIAFIPSPSGPVTVISVVGRTFMNVTADCPFRCVDGLLASGTTVGPVIVEIHAEATSEKQALAWYLDGRVAAVVGTHTHVQTADERILPKGTGYLTDLGMTGPRDSVLGRQVEAVIRRFLTGMLTRFEVAGGPAVLEGCLVEVDPMSRRAVGLTRICRCEE